LACSKPTIAPCLKKDFFIQKKTKNTSSQDTSHLISCISLIADTHVKEPHPDLVYGQIVKENEGGRIVKITYRIKCGAERLKHLGLKISTTLLERLNLTIRQTLSPLVRKTLGFCKKRENLRKQTTFFQAFYNFARPHIEHRKSLNWKK
jgi:hypothetical protein